MPGDESGNGQTIRLRQSPLLLLVKDLCSQFPDVELDLIDKVVVDSNCNPDVAHKLLSDYVEARRASTHRERKASNDEWFARFGVASSLPSSEMKVYRLP